MRKYDVVVLGATGYTGKLAAEHICTHLPTNLHWAIAGRSEQKLIAVIDELKKVNPNRSAPEIEIANLSPDDLASLAKKTKVLINTVGPYHLYSTPVVEACAENGTHYLDVTGEAPWTLQMIRKYHSTAQANKAIMIPQIGIESAPSDLITYALASHIRHKYQSGVGDVVGTTHVLSASPSGGTLATVLSIADFYSKAELAEANRGNWIFSPIPHPKPTATTTSSLFSLRRIARSLFGVRTVPELGTLTSSIAGSTNRAIVQRTWGLLDEGRYYGPNFRYQEYTTVRNRFVGVVVHFALIFGVIALAIPPFKWILKKLVTSPGQGQSREVTRKDVFDFRAVATADRAGEPKRAVGRVSHVGGAYYMTGIFLAEAAMVLVKDERLVEKLSGGFMTPAMLGQHYIDRLGQAGVDIDVETR